MRNVDRRGRAFRSAPLSVHVAYLERDAAAPNATAFVQRGQKDRDDFLFIAGGCRRDDLKAFTLDLAAQMESDLGMRLDASSARAGEKLPGCGRGWTLARRPEAITLLNIYDAVEDAPIFALHASSPEAFRADHPFLCYLVDDTTGAILSPIPRGSGK